MCPGGDSPWGRWSRAMALSPSTRGAGSAIMRGAVFGPGSQPQPGCFPPSGDSSPSLYTCVGAGGLSRGPPAQRKPCPARRGCDRARRAGGAPRVQGLEGVAAMLRSETAPSLWCRVGQRCVTVCDTYLPPPPPPSLSSGPALSCSPPCVFLVPVPLCRCCPRRTEQETTKCTGAACTGGRETEGRSSKT